MNMQMVLQRWKGLNGFQTAQEQLGDLSEMRLWEKIFGLVGFCWFVQYGPRAQESGFGVDTKMD